MHHDLYFLIIEKTMKTSHQPQRVSNRSRFYIIFSKKLLSYKRCSRSLCSSQTTTPPHTPPPESTHPRNTSPKTRSRTPAPPHGSVMCRKPETNQHKKVLLPQDPTVCQTPPTTTKQPLMKRSPHPLKGCCTYFRSPRANRHLFH